MTACQERKVAREMTEVQRQDSQEACRILPPTGATQEEVQ